MLKTYSHLAGAQRMPSEYELVTTNLLYYTKNGFEVDVPLKKWYQQYQQGSPLRCSDWEQFRDPRQTIYTSYTELQRQKNEMLLGADLVPYAIWAPAFGGLHHLVLEAEFDSLGAFEGQQELSKKLDGYAAANAEQMTLVLEGGASDRMIKRSLPS